MNVRQCFAGMAAASILALAACNSAGGGGGAGKPVATGKAANETVTLSTSSGQLTSGKNDVTVTLTDASGKPVDAQAKRVRFYMAPMGSMAAMNAEAPLKPAGKPGVFKGSIEVPMSGTWQTTVTVQDASGSHQAVMTVRAK